MAAVKRRHRLEAETCHDVATLVHPNETGDGAWDKRDIPGAQGEVGTSTGQILHGKYTTAEPLPYWEFLNTGRVLQPQVKFF